MKKNNEPNGFLGAGDNDWFFIELAFVEPCDDCCEGDKPEYDPDDGVRLADHVHGDGCVFNVIEHAGV